MSGEAKHIFDLSSLTIKLLPYAIDITGGLVLKESSVVIERQNRDLVKVKSGLGGEVLISENIENIHILTLEYLPTATAVYQLGLLQKSKTQFGIYIKNDRAPKYKGIASECRILDKPKIAIGTSGFSDTAYKILMTDYIEAFLPN